MTSFYLIFTEASIQDVSVEVRLGNIGYTAHFLDIERFSAILEFFLLFFLDGGSIAGCEEVVGELETRDGSGAPQVVIKGGSPQSVSVDVTEADVL